MDYYSLFKMVIEQLLEKAEQSLDDFNYSENKPTEHEPIFSIMRDAPTRLISYKDEDDDLRVEVEYDFNSGTMAIEIGQEDRREIEVGFGSELHEIKKSFFKLYRVVKQNIDVNLAAEDLNDFYDIVNNRFPTAVDKFLLEDDND